MYVHVHVYTVYIRQTCEELNLANETPALAQVIRRTQIFWRDHYKGRNYAKVQRRCIHVHTITYSSSSNILQLVQVYI